MCSCPWRLRSPTRSMRRTRRALFIATSSPRTSSSPSADTPRFSTSGWRRGRIPAPGDESGEIADHSDQYGDPTLGDKDLTSKNMALGTVSYMSPEQVAGKDLDERTDLFSFGVTLYEMASGRLPFDRDTARRDLWAQSCTKQPAPPSQLEPAGAAATGRDHQQGAGERPHSALSACLGDARRSATAEARHGEREACDGQCSACTSAAGLCKARRRKCGAKRCWTDAGLNRSARRWPGVAADRRRTLLSLASAQQAPHRERHHRARRFRQQHGRCRFRRHAEDGAHAFPCGSRLS